MSQGNSDEMPQEVDFTGGVRGKYLARYQRRAGLTTAVGPITLNILSTGEPLAAKIVVLPLHTGFHINPRDSRIIAPEVLTRNA